MSIFNEASGLLGSIYRELQILYLKSIRDFRDLLIRLFPFLKVLHFPHVPLSPRARPRVLPFLRRSDPTHSYSSMNLLMHESDVVVHTKAKLLTYLDTKKVTTPVVQAKATGKPKIFSPTVPCEVTVSAAVKANLS